MSGGNPDQKVYVYAGFSSLTDTVRAKHGELELLGLHPTKPNRGPPEMGGAKPWLCNLSASYTSVSQTVRNPGPLDHGNLD